MLKDFQSIDIQTLNAIFSTIADDAEQIIWINSANFTRQIYISETFEKIYHRSREELYNDASAFYTYLEDPKELNAFHKRNELLTSKVYCPDNSEIIKNYFHRRGLNNEIIFSYSVCIPLLKDNKLFAFAGVESEISQAQWEEETKSSMLHMRNIPLVTDLKNILQSEFDLVSQHQDKQASGSYVELANNKIVPITKREAQCLHHLLQGHSAKVLAILFVYLGELSRNI